MIVLERARMYLVSATVLCVLVLAVAACEEDVTDGLSTDRPFTMYGYIDPTADTQYVRIFPIMPTNLEPEGAAPLDATVTFREMASGATITAEDSVVQFFSGRYGHVFWAPFSPAFGGTYHIEVRRSDGATSSAQTDVPPEMLVTLGEPYTEFRLENEGYVPLLPADLLGEDMRLLRLNARYEVELLNVGRQTIEIPYLAEAVPTPDGWHVEVNLREDFLTIFDELRNLRVQFGSDIIEFLRLDLVPEVADPQWEAPGGVFDADLLVEPGVFDNVENGFGFFASAYRQTRRVTVNGCLQYIAGFAQSAIVCSAEQQCDYLERCDE